LRQGAHAICEKPLVLNPWNVDALLELEKETGKRVYTILQLRLHPGIIALKKKVSEGPKDKVYDVELVYITSRGNWYHHSWKGDIQKSGGIATNIGIHFFDMLSWVFGDVKKNAIKRLMPESAEGYLELANARVKWMLSIDYNDIPQPVKASGKRTFRSLTMEGDEIEFSDGFTDLHTKSYEEILKGNGFGLQEAKTSIALVQNMRG
jgi:UDP-N-acetyl-2-amino-2-deoxyglucuronate dehydrogenase